MLNLLLVLGAAFLIKGILFCLGRTLPKNALEKIKDPVKLKSWYRGTGTVQILWGVSCLLLWAANQWIPYALYLLGTAVLCVLVSMVLSLRTTQNRTPNFRTL